MKTQKLTIVIPAYNEEEILVSSVHRLIDIEDQIATRSNQGLQEIRADILIVDDGSKDRTWELIEQLHQENSRVCGLRFSRNFGHQSALIAGLTEAVKTADMLVTIDADLQDDPDKIPDMVNLYAAGDDLVYGVRNNRDSDSWFKRTTAQGYYRTLRLLGVELVPNHADFRLMSKRATETLLNYHERNLFIRGIIPKLGFKTGQVEYKRTPRLAGESKYPFKKNGGLCLGWHYQLNDCANSTDFDSRNGGLPACDWNGSLRGYFKDSWADRSRLVFTNGFHVVLRWRSADQLGVIGEYIGKLMTEIKGRPRYTIQTKLE